MPNNVYAYAQTNGTNVSISWTPAISLATNYIIERGINDYDNSTYDFSPVAMVGTNTKSFVVTDAIASADNWSDEYAVVAVYPGGGLSAPAISAINGGGNTNSPAGPTGIYGYMDGTGTNLIVAWSPASGAIRYLVYGVNADFNSPIDSLAFILLGQTAGISLELLDNLDGFGNASYARYQVVAVYADGSQSQPSTWYPYQNLAAPATINAIRDKSGTNIILYWSSAPGPVTGYTIQKNDFLGTTPLGTVSSNTFSIVDIGGGVFDPYLEYQVQATYPGGGISWPATASVTNGVLGPYGLSVTVDPSGTNAILKWFPSPAAVSNYVVLRVVYNPSTGTYSYTVIGTVSTNTTTFTDTGGISGPNSFNNVYEVEADNLDGSISAPDTSVLNGAFQQYDGFNPNLSVSAQMVRNGSGRWQLMFSAIPTNIISIALRWNFWDYFDDASHATGPGTYPLGTETDIPVSILTNGIYIIPDSMTTGVIGNSAVGLMAMVQPISTNGVYGNQFNAGFLPYDEPAFADGREELKQNLLYQLRAATISQPKATMVENNIWYYPFYVSFTVPVDTNYVESSFFHQSLMYKGYNAPYVLYTKLDDLWPFTVNYQFHQNVYDPGYTGPSSFTWSGSVSSAPAPSVLGISDPYWVLQQSAHSSVFDETNLEDCGAYTNSDNLYLQSGLNNLFGLAFQTALVNVDPVTFLGTGTSILVTNANQFYSATADPSLTLDKYYFTSVSSPGTGLPSETVPPQPHPIPCDLGFASTNETDVIIASVGNPIVIGGWAQFSIASSSTKRAYLGQYFVTNAFIVTNGAVSGQESGVVSPYGDFFPTEAGQMALVTMPDPDSAYPQGTGVVDVISLNVDANHDGTMDLAYTGPDFVSSGKPFRFWVNDDKDWSDDTGDGIPGQGAQGDGVTPIASPEFPSSVFNVFGTVNEWRVHGRRDLVDYFPVDLNIGSLFQSNALSSGIDVTDTNYQFVLSQADAALRFTYTSLTTTNYMNFLRDTNESGLFSSAMLFTISNSVNGGTLLEQSFISTIATNNGGIILVEAWTNTTQPLVLTIYHGTNQIAQTQLYLSISGVEQMFRHKNILVNPDPSSVRDRLTDEDVPNEPDTINKNFVFLHGYNVNPQQARGWEADFFKRMYWSGSHARFYGLTWEGSDSQIAGQVTINLQTNILHAFDTAPLLNDFLNDLPGTNVLASHSLGNIVILSTLNDYSNQNINTYFMIDAAVSIEALQGSAPQDPNLIYPTWRPYTNWLYASAWWKLFPTNDARSTLTWNNRFSNLGNTELYNFYSSGEEVLREYTNGTPPSQLVGSADQVKFFLENELFETGLPVGCYTWSWQEMLKGQGTFNGLLSSTHGGWQFNSLSQQFLVQNFFGTFVFMGPGQTTSLTASEIQTNTFFNLNSANNAYTVDQALLASGASSYAQAHRNRIISDTIPCLTLPVGANPIPGSGIVDLNLDEQTIENGWPAGRTARTTGAVAAGEWHHSDCRQVAYTFTHNLFDNIVTFGGLQ